MTEAERTVNVILSAAKDLRDGLAMAGGGDPSLALRMTTEHRSDSASRWRDAKTE